MDMTGKGQLMQGSMFKKCFGGRWNGCILMSLSSSTLTRGRIPLNDFYNSSMYRHWRFTESPEYLRHLAFMQPWLDVVQTILMPCTSTCCIFMVGFDSK